jgi:hypothetical protein
MLNNESRFANLISDLLNIGVSVARLKEPVLVMLLFIGLSYPAAAHHSAACCDFTQSVPVEGIVKSIEVMNPHTKLVLIVMDKDGNTREIYFEGHSRNNVYCRGWRPDMVKAGDKITIHIAPVKTGGDGGYIHSITLPVGPKEQAGAAGLMRRFSDQNVTLTDAVGLYIMQQHKIKKCWSTDFHLGLTGVPLVINKH